MIIPDNQKAGIKYFHETTAQEGDPHYSRLSLISNTFFIAERLEEIGSDAYYPSISGSTSILRLKPKAADDPRQEILRHILLQDDKKLKNALREALIVSSHTLESPSTKREAKKHIRSMALNGALLEKRGARLSLSELQLLIKRL
jgi:16S rRNA A1518/A1519 N6-dimethyltransferase RsmA/KsgA/DIM1 with predicted DNA glycosylase/AP lyase activity